MPWSDGAADEQGDVCDECTQIVGACARCGAPCDGELCDGCPALDDSPPSAKERAALARILAPTGFLAAIDAMRDRLLAAGIQIDIKRALASIQDDDDTEGRCDMTDTPDDDEPDDFGDDLDDEGCVLGVRCLCPHPDHMSDECFSLEMAEDYHRRASAEEHPDGGDCEVCGDLTHMATMVYQLPVHGAYASPAPSRLCEACAYELAEMLSEWAESERAHARKCGATIPGERS